MKTFMFFMLRWVLIAIIYFGICCLLVICPSSKVKANEITVNTAQNSYYYKVESDVYKTFTLIDKRTYQHVKIHWSDKHIEELTNVLLLIENRFQISHNKILALILTESRMDVDAVSPRNKNGSRDIGLSQQTSTYIYQRYAVAKSILRKEGVYYSNSMFDISVNVMAAAIVLVDFNKEVRRMGATHKYAQFAAYNVGPGGYFYPRLQVKKMLYLNTFKRYLIKL